MSVAMPAAVVLIVCKVAVAGPPDQNVDFTGAENLKWATEHSMMVCRRQEVQLFDRAESLGAAAQPFNMKRCQRSGIMLGAAWDAGHRSSRYRFWRVACPVPIVNTITGEVIAWAMPDCGKRDVVRCEVDTPI
jgi:hypothetical protein